MSDDARATQNAVRDQLVAVARAQQRPQPAVNRRRRRRWRGIAVLGVAALGFTASAGATRLLSVGEPIPSLFPQREVNQAYVASDGPQLVATAADPDRRYPWGVGIYETAAGQHCVIAGQAIGSQLGLERGGKFHPYGPDVTGACNAAGKPVSDRMVVHGPNPRTILIGRTGDRKSKVVLIHRGKRRAIPLARDGTMLVVLDGIETWGDYRLELG